MSKDNVYTDVVLADMAERYQAATDDDARAAVVEAVASELGTSVHSVRAKMHREGYYIAKVYKTKAGEKAESKGDIVETIAAVMGVQSSENLPGLEKANKQTLTAIRAALQTASDIVAEKDGEPETS